MAVSLRAPVPNPRQQVLRSPPGEPAWELWRRTPPRALAGIVAGLWAGGTADAFARHRVLPNGELVLMFHVGPGQHVVEADGRPCSDRRGAGFVAGVHERPFTIESPHRDTYVVTARLLPAGAAAIFHEASPAELAANVVDLEDAFDRRSEVGRLGDALRDAADLGAALDLLEGWLLARIEPRRLPHAATCAASALIARTQGRLRLGAVAREVGYSPRRLNELFQRDVGIPAKRFARIARFRRALDRLSAAPEADLAQLASAAGYYDQAHLARDFRSLALLTPTEYLAALGSGEDGPDVIAG